MPPLQLCLAWCAVIFVCAHSIDEQIGVHRLFHSAALCNKVLCGELRGERGCLHHDPKDVHINSLLTLLEDVVEQGVFERLQLAKRASILLLIMARLGLISSLCCFIHFIKSE